MFCTYVAFRIDGSKLVNRSNNQGAVRGKDALQSIDPSLSYRI